MIAEVQPVDYYSLYTKNCTVEFSEQEVRKVKHFIVLCVQEQMPCWVGNDFLKKMLIGCSLGEKKAWE